MRPLVLTFEAFGSYLNRTSIDFQKLNEHSLFVISGQTGAGKSTIYDAITYALYGEGNGKGRKDRLDLRNQMAERTKKTNVEFQFELKGKTYRIFREYGHTGTDSCAFEVQVGGQWQAVPVENQRMTAYNKKIEEVLGISADQFKQIVILPQGEYEEFLTSDSKGKMKILRSIFETDKIVRVLDLLKEQVRMMEQEIKQFMMAKKTIQSQWQTKFANEFTSKTHHVLLAEHVIDEELLDAIGQDTQVYRQQKDAKQQLFERLKEEVEQLDKQLQAQILHNQHVESYHQHATHFAKLEEEKGEIEQLSESLIRAQEARFLTPLEMTMNSSDKQLIEHQKTLVNERKELDDIQAKSAETQACVKRTDALREQLGVLQRRQLDFEQQADIVNQLENDERDIAELVREIPILNANIPKLQTVKEQAVLTLQAAQQNRSVIRYVLQKMLDVEKRQTKRISSLAVTEASAVETATEVYKEWLASYREDLATFHLPGAWSNEDIHKYLHSMDDQDDTQSKNGQISELEKQIKHANQEIERITQICNAKQTELDSKRMAYHRSIQVLSSLLDSDQPTLLIYHEKKTSLKTKIEQMVAEMKANEDAIQQWHVNMEKQKATVASVEKQSNTFQLALQEATSVFEKDLDKSTFQSLDDYLIAKTMVPSIDTWVSQITKYNTQWVQTAETLTNLREVLKEQFEQFDTDNISVNLDRCRTLQHELATEVGSIQEIITQLVDSKAQYESNVTQSKTQEQRLIPAKELKEVLEGGTRQISFENHILMYHFKEILRFANQRLLRMVHNRYQLTLNDDVSKNTEALDLFVFDNQTGQTRPVHTLSGGEKFMASLALGLGATDSIHATRGGIEMNMMFIDEGFGTLDESKLEEAVRVLLEISKGRVIGVISHRSELKEQMPAMIEVMNRDGISSLCVTNKQ